MSINVMLCVHFGPEKTAIISLRLSASCWLFLEAVEEALWAEDAHGDSPCEAAPVVSELGC